MYHIVPTIAGVTLACFTIREVKKTYREYPKIKQAVADGDSRARTRLYLHILRFEWISAPLALIALSFDRSRLVASALQLEESDFGKWVAQTKEIGNNAMMVGLGTGLVIGLLLVSVIRLRGRKRAHVATDSSPSTPKPWLRRLIPDISTLIPTTGRERLIFSAVAISAGICEEIVFRGWLLYVLHNPIGLTGMALVLFAATLFGLCHIYQGPTGVVATTAAGVLLTGVYVATGTLLVPIVLHALIDIRMAIVPSGTPRLAKAEPA
jgi:CAAX protease family protein